MKKIVWRQLEVRVFRCVASVAHLFYMQIGGYMNKDNQKKAMDITGEELMFGASTVAFLK